MKRLLPLLLAACATAPPAEPERVAYAAALLGRPEAPPPAAPESKPIPRAPEAARGEAEEVLGLLTLTPERRTLKVPKTRDELVTLAYLRSPAVRAARARLEAARTAYDQADDLKDLVAIYRSFVRETKTRVGPETSRRATATIAPSPNVDALTGDFVRLTIERAFEELRAVVRDTVAAAERAHADAARLAAARRILEADVALQQSLVDAVRARFEAGRATQAGLLAFRARLERLRTELAVLRQEEPVVRARWNRLLSRPADDPLSVDVEPAPRGEPPDADAVRARALAERQEHRAAILDAQRAAVAVRLAETMTLPRMDLGSSRFERERAADVFPEPGRMQPARADFGVREAQVREMRERQVAAERTRDAWRDRVRTEVEEALFALDAATRRYEVLDREVVPLAGRAFESARGAFEGAGADYVELLDRARELLRAQLAQVDARRAHAHARARLLEAVGVRSSP